MKRQAAAILAALCLCLLTACGGERVVSGRVVELQTADGVGVTALVVRDDEGKEHGILLTPETWVSAEQEELDEEAFRAGELRNVLVTAFCDGKRQTLTTEDGGDVEAYPARRVDITGYLTEETATLSDGTTLAIWRESRRRSMYLLPDGTELLRRNEPFGPDNVYVGGIESFDDLAETAKPKVLQFYEDQGLLYDLQEQLETAYQAYCNREAEQPFYATWVMQDIVPTASNDRVMYFLTTVTLPLGNGTAYEVQRGAAFDRTTGENIPVWDLFSCSPEEAKEGILDSAQVKDPVLRQEMLRAFVPDSLVFYPDNLGINFPQGTLPSQELSYSLGVDYDEKLTAILRDWAVPRNAG